MTWVTSRNYVSCRYDDGFRDAAEYGELYDKDRRWSLWKKTLSHGNPIIDGLELLLYSEISYKIGNIT